MEQENLLAQEASKRNIERSASYPGIPVEVAIIVAEESAKAFGYNVAISREDIALAMRMSPTAVSRHVAATVHFGFFTREKDRYKLTQRYKDYSNPISPEERQRIIIDAFKTPRLYADLIDKFDGRAIPSELKVHLVRFHAIAANASEFAAGVFLESAKFAGVLTENNILKVAERYEYLLHHEDSGKKEDTVGQPPAIEGSAPATVDTPPEIDAIPPAPVLPVAPRHTPQLALPEANNLQTEEIKLTEKQLVTFRYPDTLTAKDFRMIKKRLDLLAEAMGIDLTDTP